VKLAEVGSDREQELLPLHDGEQVLLWEPGLEVEATLALYGGDYWMARPDSATWRDLPLSPPNSNRFPDWFTHSRRSARMEGSLCQLLRIDQMTEWIP